jgi:hypothetical protein
MKYDTFIAIYRDLLFFNFVDQFTALRFMANSALLAARRI